MEISSFFDGCCSDTVAERDRELLIPVADSVDHDEDASSYKPSPSASSSHHHSGCEAKRLLVKYGPLLSVVSIVVLFVYLVATPSKSSGAKGSKKKR